MAAMTWLLFPADAPLVRRFGRQDASNILLAVDAHLVARACPNAVWGRTTHSVESTLVLVVTIFGPADVW